MPTPLDQEIRFYNDNLADWLTRFKDRFVLVKGDELIGVYNTSSEALAEGARRFGLQSFLVRQVQEQQPDIYSRFSTGDPSCRFSTSKSLRSSQRLAEIPPFIHPRTICISMVRRSR